MFEVLSFSSHTGVQPSMPLVDGFVRLSTTRCSRPDHAAIRCCIVCYRARFKLVLDYRKCFRF